MALSGALVMSYYIDLPGFRTVLLHELAHLRNRDVTLTYVALSMTWAFMATAFVPNVVVILTHKPDLSGILLTAAEVGTFGLCAVLTRAAILRARELYADVRSATWHHDPQRVEAVFVSLPHPLGKAGNSGGVRLAKPSCAALRFFYYPHQR